MGGSWERLVRSIKTALKVILPEGSLPEELLRNVLLEAEHMVNCRPLTYVSIGSEDNEALTRLVARTHLNFLLIVLVI